MASIEDIEESKKQLFEELDEQTKREKKAFVAGYRVILSLKFIRNGNREIKIDGCEKQMFVIGQICGFASVVGIALLVIWIFVGG